jgi:hypothetical protein
MAIKWFGDLKYNNSGALAATSYGEFNAVGNSGTNNYASNGYTNNGLDLSVQFTSTSGGRNYTYAQKNNIFTGTSSYACLGFALNQNWQYSPTALANLSISVGTATLCAMSQDNNWLVAGGTSGFAIYRNNGLGTYTAYATGVLSGTTIYSIGFSPLGNLLLVASSSTLYQYTVTSTAITTSTPATTWTLPATPTWIAFDPANYYMSISYAASPYMGVYAYNFSTNLFGSTNLVSGNLPTATVRQHAWSPNGQFIAVPHDGSSLLNVYQNNNYNGTFTLSSITNTTNYLYACTWTGDSQWLLIGSYSSSYLYSFKNNNDGTFTKAGTDASQSAIIHCLQTAPDGNNIAAMLEGQSNLQTIFNNNGTFSNYPSLAITSANAETYGPIIAMNNTMLGITASNSNVYLFSTENKIVLLSNTTTTATNIAASPPNSSLLVTLSWNALNMYFTNSSGVITKSSVLLSSLGLSNTLSNCYFEIEINGTVANLWVNNQMVLQVSDPTIETFVAASITSTFFNYNCSTAASTNNGYITNIYTLDGTGSHNNSRLGPVTVDTYYPTSDNTVAWTPSAGTTHYNLVGDNPPSTSTYVSTTTQGTTDTLNLASQSTPTTVYASSVNVIAETTGGQAGELIITSDGTSKNNPAVTTSYTLYQQTVDNPTLGTTVSYEYSS